MIHSHHSLSEKRYPDSFLSICKQHYKAVSILLLMCSCCVGFRYMTVIMAHDVTVTIATNLRCMSNYWVLLHRVLWVTVWACYPDCYRPSHQHTPYLCRLALTRELLVETAHYLLHRVYVVLLTLWGLLSWVGESRKTGEFRFNEYCWVSLYN